MKKKIVILVFVALLAISALLLLRKTEFLYVSHEVAANAFVADLLADSNQGNWATLVNANSQGVSETRVVNWEIEEVQLTNTTPVWKGIWEDDPVYRLKVNLQVTFADESKAVLTWESWRYGIVLGPWVLSMGDGPPGYVSIQ